MARLECHARVRGGDEARRVQGAEQAREVRAEGMRQGRYFIYLDGVPDSNVVVEVIVVAPPVVVMASVASSTAILRASLRQLVMYGNGIT